MKVYVIIGSEYVMGEYVDSIVRIFSSMEIAEKFVDKYKEEWENFLEIHEWDVENSFEENF
jgi:hypothetical protein